MRHFASTTTVGRIFPRERPPRRRCLAGSRRWQTPSDPWQLFARTNRCQYDRVGIAKGFAPPRAHSSAKYWRTLANRFRQQQRNFFEQATDSSAGSAERRRSNHNRKRGFHIPSAGRDFRRIQNGGDATNVAGNREYSVLASRRGHSQFYAAQPQHAERGLGRSSRSVDFHLQGDYREPPRHY